MATWLGILAWTWHIDFFFVFGTFVHYIVHSWIYFPMFLYDTFFFEQSDLYKKDGLFKIRPLGCGASALPLLNIGSELQSINIPLDMPAIITPVDQLGLTLPLRKSNPVLYMSDL
jgi:hypothetical protein